MAIFKCEKCGASKDGRCKPQKCHQCGEKGCMIKEETGGTAPAKKCGGGCKSRK